MKYLLLSLWLFLSTDGLAAITFYDNSHGTPLINLINNAKHRVDIEIYQMDDPQVHQAIVAAVTRHVMVRIVQEPTPVGGTCNLFGAPVANETAACSSNRDLVAFVRSHGGMYVPFNKGLCGTPGTNCFEHGKIVVVDGIYAFLSTGNFNPTNLCDKTANPSTCNRDYSVVITDLNVINTLGNIFVRDLAGVPYNLAALLAMNLAPNLTVSPFSMNPMINLINSAKAQLTIETQYLLDPTVNAAILAAANRGVKVYLMVSSACSFGTPNSVDQQVWGRIYTPFEQAGVFIRTFPSAIQINGKNGYLHAKAVVVDADMAWIGSTNSSTTSLTNNREYGILTQDPAVISGVYGFMAGDMNNPNAETWQDSLQCKNDFVPESIK